jgi:hypothetical protein
MGAPADYSRIPPHDLGAERSVLGALLSEDFEIAWKEVERSGLRAEDFYRLSHQEIFRRISFLSWRAAPPDPVTIAAALEKPLGQDRDEVFALLDELHAGYYYAGNVPTYADLIMETAARRKILERAHFVAQKCYEQNGEDVSEILAGHLEDLTVLRESVRGEKIETVRGGDFLANPPPPRRLLVGDGVLAQGEWLFVMGEPKAGKSILSLDLACALAADSDVEPWCGFDVFAGGRRVLYLVGEGGAESFFPRFLKRTSELTKDEQNRIELWFPSPRLLSIDRSDEFARLRDFIVERGFDVVILDPLLHFHGLDENSNTEMRIVAGRLLELKAATGCAIIVVHHTRKATITSRKGSALEGRGASSLWGAADGAIVFDKEGENENDPERRMTFSLRNAEHEPEPRLVQLDRLSLRYETVARSLGGRPATHDMEMEDLLRYIDREGASTYDEISQGTGVPKRTLNRWLPDLLKRGLVSRARPHPRAPYRWSIPEPGTQEDLPLTNERKDP